MLLHHMSDVPTSFARAFIQTTYRTTSVVLAATMMVAWGYTRLYLFPQVIYHGLQAVFLVKGGYICEPYLSYMLSILVILHIYWYYLFILAFMRFAFKGKVEDPQQPVNEESTNKED